MLGIRNFLRLAANQAVAASTTLVTATGLVFNLAIGQRIHIRLTAGFTIGATGGFKFQMTPSQTPQYQIGQWGVIDTVTPGILGKVATDGSAFANALAVAGSHFVFADFELLGHATIPGTVSFQFACNSAANSITLLQGAGLDAIFL